MTAQLTQLRESKRLDTEHYFAEAMRDLRTLAGMPIVTEGVVAFATAMRELDDPAEAAAVATELADWYNQRFLPELATVSDGTPAVNTYMPQDNAARRLQRDYILRNPHPDRRAGLDKSGTGTSYDMMHGILHPAIRRFAETHGIDDVILVEPRDGTVVYTLSKQIDLGANLRSGTASVWGEGRAFQRILCQRDQGSVVIEDFAAYPPDYLRPTAFLATPLHQFGELVGVLIVQLSVTRLNDLMTQSRHWESIGLGRTGEVLLVGADHRMRSDSRFMLEDPERFLANQAKLGLPEDIRRRIARYRSTILLGETDSPAVRAALRGESSTGIFHDYRGEQVIGAWGPLYVGGLRMAIVAKIDAAEARAPIIALRRTIALIAAVAVLLLTCISLIIAGMFTRPLRAILSAAERLAAGDDTARIELRGRDDYQELALGFNRMADEISARNRAIEAKTRAYEDLLRNVYPEIIAERLRLGETAISERLQNVTLIVIAIDGLDTATDGDAAAMPLARLNEVVDALDEAAHRHGVEKIKTLGETYTAACGLSVARLDHARRALAFVEEAAQVVARFNHAWGDDLEIRASLVSGDVEAGLVGRHRTLYDVWGPNFGIARRVVFDTEPGHVRVAESTYRLLPDPAGFTVMPPIAARSYGSIDTWQRPAARTLARAA